MKIGYVYRFRGIFASVWLGLFALLSLCSRADDSPLAIPPVDWTAGSAWRAYLAERQAGEPEAAATSQNRSEVAAATSGNAQNNTLVSTIARALATSSDKKVNALRMLNWVRQNVEYLPYYGVAKGAEGTAQDLEGNDFDQCVLLNALLQTLGFSYSDMAYHETDAEYSPSQIASWLHWDALRAVAAFTRLGIPSSYNGTMIRVRRVWLEVRVDGQTYILDPGYRETLRDPVVGIQTIDTAYSAASITAFANPNAFDNDEVRINSTGVEALQSALSARAVALTQAVVQNNAGFDPGLLLGQLRPSGEQLQSLPTSTTGTVVGSSSGFQGWDIPATRIRSFILSMSRRKNGYRVESVQTFAIPEYSLRAYGIDMRASGRKMMLCRTDTQADILHTLDMPAGSDDWSVDFEIFEWFPELYGNGYPLRVYQALAIPFSNSAGISQRMGMYWTRGSSRGALKRAAAQHVTTLETYGNDSAEAHASARYLLILQRAVMSDNARLAGASLSGSVSFDAGSIWFTRETVGTGKWLVDGPLERTAIAKVRDEGASLAAAQWGIAAMNSAAEHATMELAGSSAAASTISTIESAFRSGMKLVRLRGEDWGSTVGKAGGSGHLIPGVEEAVTKAGYKVRAFVPDSLDVTIYQSNGLKSSCALLEGKVDAVGTDPAYWSMDGALITGNFQGGASPNMQAAPSFIAANTVSAPVEKPATAAPTPTGADPVDLNSGAFLYTVDGLSSGSGAAPRGLSLKHYYSSAKVGVDRVGLGRGWTHSYDIAVSTRNFADLDPRSASVAEIAPYLVGMRYMLDIGTTDPTAKEVGLKAIAAGWLARQFRDAQVVVRIGADELRFFRTQNNTYFPTSGIAASLTGSSSAGFQLQFRHGNKILFRGGDGRATSITDPYEKSLLLEYYPGTEKLLRVSDCWGRKIEFYFNNSVLTAASSAGDGNDGSARWVNYTRTATVSGESDFTIVDPEQSGTVFHEDQLGRVTSVTDARSRVVIANTFDGFGRVESQLPLNDTTRKTTIGYVPGLTRESDALNNDSWHYFDSRGRRYLYVDANSASWQWTYDGADRTTVAATPRGLSDTNGGIWQFGFNANHQMVSVTNPKGDSRSIEIDDTNNQIRIHNYENKETTVDLTAQYAVRKITTPGGLVSEFEYNTAGQLTKFRAPAQSGLAASIATTFTDFDSWGNATTITDSNGNVAKATYNKRGQPTTILGRRGEKLTVTYNNRGQSTHVYRWYNEQDPTSSLYDARVYDEVGYDSVGDVDYVISGAAVRNGVNNTVISAGRKVDFDYNALGDLVSVEQMLSNNSTVRLLTNTYDVRNNLWKSTDALDHTVENNYDAIGRPRWVKDALGRTSRFHFDDDGNLTDSVSPRYRTVSGDTDLRGLLESAQDPIGKVIKYGYDKDGRITSLKNRRNNTYTWEYDDVARTLSLTTPLNFKESVQINTRGLVAESSKASGVKFVATSWDNEGRVLTESDLKADQSHTFTRTYVYEANGLLSQATETNSSGTYTSTRRYDQLNRLYEYNDGEGNVIGYSYYPDGRLKKLRYPGGTKEVTYAYDDFGRLAAVTDWNNDTTTYSYDAAGRLTNTLRPNGTTRVLTYYDDNQLKQVVEKRQNQAPIWFVRLLRDEDGLVNERVLLSGPTPRPVASDEMTFDADNRISTFNGQAVMHDSDGNMTNGPSPSGTFVTYAYDTRDRLISAGGLNYRYGVDGFRMAVSGSGANLLSAWDPNSGLGNLLVKTVGTSKTHYVYGIGLLYEVADNATTPSHTYHYDELGSTIALTDAGGNAVTDTIEYSPYGLIISRAGVSQTEFLYHGAWGVNTDPNGLNYMRARYFNWRTLRFMNADPISFWGGVNWYKFAGNNPLCFIDPLGLRDRGISHVGFDGNGEPVYQYLGDSEVEIARYDAAVSSLRHFSSFAVSFSPVGGTLQSGVELASGRDFIAAEDANRYFAAVGLVAGLVPAGKPLMRAGMKVFFRRVKTVDQAVELAVVVAKKGDGVIYLRHNPKLVKDYVGQAESWVRYLARQGEHDRAKAVKHMYDVLLRGRAGASLDVLEEAAMRAYGGTAKQAGVLQNLRKEMSDERFMETVSELLRDYQLKILAEMGIANGAVQSSEAVYGP